MTPRLTRIFLISFGFKKKKKKEEEERGFQIKEPFLNLPFMETLAERCFRTRDLLHSPIKVPGI
jgi:hypothetical protein